jgi:hypothetical protein
MPIPAPESRGLWRADNLATPDQVDAIREYLVTQDYVLADQPPIYRLASTPEHAYRTLAIISNLIGGVGRNPLSLMDASLQEQTHLTIDNANERGEQFFSRRTIFEIGLGVEEGFQEKVASDVLYLKLAHFDTAQLRELERQVARNVRLLEVKKQQSAPNI